MLAIVSVQPSHVAISEATLAPDTIHADSRQWSYDGSGTIMPPDAPRDLERAQSLLDAEVVRAASEIYEVRRQPGTIYHYTSAAGLLSILRTGKLWASGILSLSDPTEGNFACGRMVELLRSRQPDVPDSAVDSISSEQISKYWQANLFVCCFCADRDGLGDWRGYGQNGNGYALGINRRRFEREKENSIRMAPVTYGSEHLDRIVGSIVNHAAETVKESGFEQQDLDEYWRSVTSWLVELAPQFKHPAYKEEHEWRAILWRGDRRPEEVQFREAQSRVIPYVELTLPRAAISEVLLGPKLDRSQAPVIKKLLESVDCGAEVTTSEIPLR